MLIATWQKNDQGTKKEVWFKDSKNYNHKQNSSGVGKSS